MARWTVASHSSYWTEWRNVARTVCTTPLPSLDYEPPRVSIECNPRVSRSIKLNLLRRQCDPMDHSTGVRCLATVLRVIITLVLMNWQLRGARASSRPAARWSTCAWPCRNHGSSSPAPVRTGCVHKCWSVIQCRLTRLTLKKIQCHNVMSIILYSL